MHSPPEEKPEPQRKKSNRTVAELLFRMPSVALRRDLEVFRIGYEKVYGPTDLTKRYTSTWPGEQADWLFEHHPKLFWDGLPPFVQAFVLSRIQAKHHNGELDDVPETLMRLYLNGNLRTNDEGREA